MIVRREGPGVLVRVALIALVAQVLALGCWSSASEFRGASGFAYALGAFVLVRSFARNPLESALMAFAGFAYATGIGAGAIVSPWLPADVRPDQPVHLAVAMAGALVAMTSGRRCGAVASECGRGLSAPG